MNFKIFLKLSKIQYHYNSLHSSEEHQAFFAETWLQLQQKECPNTHGDQHLEEAFQSYRTLLISRLWSYDLVALYKYINFIISIIIESDLPLFSVSVTAKRCDCIFFSHN